MPMAVLRTRKANCVRGGMSAAFAELLKITFEAPVCITRGIVLHLPSPQLLLGRFGVFLADGDAERVTWTCKGASGLRPCFKCANVAKSSHALGEGLVDIGRSDVGRFQQLTDQDVYDSVDTLKEAFEIASPDDFDERRVAYSC